MDPNNKDHVQLRKILDHMQSVYDSTGKWINPVSSEELLSLYESVAPDFKMSSLDNMLLNQEAKLAGIGQQIGAVKSPTRYSANIAEPDDRWKYDRDYVKNVITAFNNRSTDKSQNLYQKPTGRVGMVEDAYKSIGRSPRIGTGADEIDEQGWNYWKGVAADQSITPDQI